MTEQEQQELDRDLSRMDDDGFGSAITTTPFTPIGPWAVADTEAVAA